MVTLDNEQYITLKEAAKYRGTSYNAIQLWLSHHREVPRRKFGTLVLVKLSDLSSYKPHQS